MRREMATIEKRLPSKQALISAASVSPTTGMSSTSRKPSMPGSPKAATTIASCRAQCSAANVAVA